MRDAKCFAAGCNECPPADIKRCAGHPGRCGRDRFPCHRQRVGRLTGVGQVLMGGRTRAIHVALVNGSGKGANPRNLETNETDTAESSPANYGGKTAGSRRLSHVGSVPSESAGSPGLWSAPSPGSNATVESARTTRIGYKPPRPCSTSPPPLLCSIGSHQHETFQTFSKTD